MLWYEKCWHGKEICIMPTPSEGENSEQPEALGSLDEGCIFCHDVYMRMYSGSASGQGWVRCEECGKLAHNECAGFREGEEDYKCDFCSFTLGGPSYPTPIFNIQFNIWF